MPRLRIDPAFEERLDRLDAAIRKRAITALERFMIAPARTGANFERIEGTNGRYWSLRVTRNFRIILRLERDDSGDVFAAVDVGPHDIYRRYPGRR
jgi:plasmid maintenance system killer protein